VSRETQAKRPARFLCLVCGGPSTLIVIGARDRCLTDLCHNCEDAWFAVPQHVAYSDRAAFARLVLAAVALRAGGLKFEVATPIEPSKHDRCGYCGEAFHGLTCDRVRA